MSDSGSMDFFQDDPMAQPLTYPGRIPSTSGVLVDGTYLPLQAVEGAMPGEWKARRGGESETLADLLARTGFPSMEVRHPVVAIGSNASPSQMRRKFMNLSIQAVIPMTLATVCGIAPGVSAHVNRWGYIPAAPVEVHDEVSRLFVLWLDDRELATLDLTEPNYWRRCMPVDLYPVTLESGVRLPPPFVYVGRHGCLVDDQRKPRRLTDQRTLIGVLLAESQDLREQGGDTPDEFVLRARDENVRAAISHLMAERWASLQPELRALPTE